MIHRHPIRILCVDDHAFLVDGLRARFELERDIEFVGHLETAENLLPTVEELQPDIVLLDIEMPGPDPFEAAENLQRTSPKSRVIFLSAYIRDHYISTAVNAGAFGYFSKSEDPDAIIDGIRTVARKGEFAFGPKVRQRCLPHSNKSNSRASGTSDKAPLDNMLPLTTKLDSLTAREQEVLRFIGRGMGRTEIAETLHRSAKTVDGHREKIMQKLDIHDRGELVRFAIREGLVEA